MSLSMSVSVSDYACVQCVWDTELNHVFKTVN
jgi:hypothetical protein